MRAEKSQHGTPRATHRAGRPGERTGDGKKEKRYER